jgi:shikimate 5-dehydrogenase
MEPYNICNEYIVNSCIGVSIIFNSTNIGVQDQIMPIHEFHSLLQKMNNERLIFYDVIYRKKTKSK